MLSVCNEHKFGEHPTTRYCRTMFASWRERWNRVLNIEREGYPFTASSEQLSEALKEVATQARNVFLIYMTVVAYAAIALANVRDADFFGGSSGIKLPVIDVSPAPAVFFAVMPGALIALAAYLQIYIAQMHRLRRRLQGLQRKGGQPVDPDTLYPWVATLMLQGGVYGGFVRFIYAALVWWATPLIVMLYWARLLVVRGSFGTFVQGNGPPSAALVGVFGLFAAVAALVWSRARHSLDATYGLRPQPSRIQLVCCVSICLVMATVIAMQPVWQSALCRYNRITAICSLNLSQAFLAEPPSDRSKRALGSRIKYADLSHANMSWAFVDNSDLSSTSMVGANLTGTSFVGARLWHAHFDDSTMVETRFKDADLSQASLREVYVDRADFTDVTLEGADLSASLIEEATFTGADLLQARSHGTHFVGLHMEGASVREASFEGADLSGAHLEGADFSESHLEGVNFKGAHLSGAIFKRAFLDGADFTDALIGGAAEPPINDDVPMSERTARRVRERSGRPADFEDATARIVCGQTPVRAWEVAGSAAACKAARDAAVGVRAKDNPQLAATWEKLKDGFVFRLFDHVE